MQAARAEGIGRAREVSAQTLTAATNSIQARIEAEDAYLNPLQRNINATAARNTELFNNLMDLILTNEDLLRNLTNPVDLQPVQPVDIPVETQTAGRTGGDAAGST